MIENDNDIWYQHQSYSGSSSRICNETVGKKASEKLIATPTSSNSYAKSMNIPEPFSLSELQFDYDDDSNNEEDDKFYLVNSTKKSRANTMDICKVQSKIICPFQLSNYSNKAKDKDKPTIIKSLKNHIDLLGSPIKQPIKKQLTDFNKSTSKRYSFQYAKQIEEIKSKRRASAMVIQSIIKENISEIKALTNTEEISDFYEYNDACMEIIHNLKPICSSPPQIDIPFAKEIPSHKRLAVFDLDETLVHAQLKDIETAQYIIHIKLPSNKIAEVGLNIRPHWQEALDQIANNYFIIVYTASDHSYADAVLDFMDPNNHYFKYRLYRNNCSSAEVDGQRVYVKDLNIFKEIQMKDIVIIDNSILSYAYHLHNGIPILPYYDSKKDFELIFLAGYLNFIVEYEDLREANKKYIKFDNENEGNSDELKIEKVIEENEEQVLTSDEEINSRNTTTTTTFTHCNTSSPTSQIIKRRKEKSRTALGNFLKVFNMTTSNKKNKI